jgi:hypothetical protein
VPPDVEQARPPPSNQPPFVLRAWPEPGVIRVAKECPQIHFQLLGISDCDAADAVSVRWFVNYDPEKPQQYDVNSTYRGGPGVSQCLRSPASDSYNFKPGEQESAADGIVHLEAVLSDGFAPQSEAPAYRAALPGKSVTRVGWTIVLTDGSACP